jgi:hypothetical protein
MASVAHRVAREGLAVGTEITAPHVQPLHTGLTDLTGKGVVVGSGCALGHSARSHFGICGEAKIATRRPASVAKRPSW